MAVQSRKSRRCSICPQFTLQSVVYDSRRQSSRQSSIDSIGGSSGFDSTQFETSAGRGGAYAYDIHFWLGKDTSQDEAGTAAIKTVELDAVLSGRAVQHREIQNHESDKFLSYFKPCIIPLEGGVATGFKKPEEEFETRLYTCKGKRVVPFSRSVLNHDDVFILDTKDKIFQFNGANSNIQERAKALEVIQFLKDKYHEGTCNVAIVDDGKLQAEGDSGEFWVIFGGFAPIGKKVATDDDIIPDKTPAKLYKYGSCFHIAGGEKYIEWAGPLDGLCPKVPLYKVTEGNEPGFFTTYFAWDLAKPLIHGNAFEKKVVMLFGAGHAAAEGNQGGGPTQRASALAALNSAFKPTGGGKAPGSPKGPSQGSQRRAAVAALSSVLTDEKKKSAEPSPVGSPEAPEAEPEAAEEPSEPAPEAAEDDSEPKVAIEEDENGILTSQSTFSYEQVKVKSENPVPGIDLKRREAYLSVEEFESVLGMSREEFYQLPKWKQDNTKKKVGLF
ncbi:hypothetical protein L6452_42441 [Arctium lappa]|uniref:Uncharacterized protein n=1 Tax=Arctium lappa TaxID=4217 RepID=A0ACB8XHS1_ARCLA|nr:hypothetical protein L6452_42441 [Arctium lappa]